MTAAGIEDRAGAELCWQEIVAEARRRWPQVTSSFSDAEMRAELRDPATLKYILGLAAGEPAPRTTLHIPEGGYAPARSVTKFPRR